jgi:hypothetical protein
MNKIQLAAAISMLCAVFSAAMPAHADDRCAQAQQLVTRLKSQVQQLTRQKNDADRSRDDDDRAEVGDDLYGRDTSQATVAEKALESKLTRLTDQCRKQGSEGPSCDQMAEAAKEKIDLEQSNPKIAKKPKHSNQGGHKKDSFELELNLRDAQSDLETATTDLNDCKSQNGQQGRSSAGSTQAGGEKSSNSGGGWSSF